MADEGNPNEIQIARKEMDDAFIALRDFLADVRLSRAEAARADELQIDLRIATNGYTAVLYVHATQGKAGLDAWSQAIDRATSKATVG